MNICEISKSFLFTIIILLFGIINTYPCSTILLKNKENILVGRNLDTSVDLPGFLCVNRRGERKESLILPTHNCHTVPWTAKYGSVTFTAMGRGFSDGGLNEKGLVIEEMSLPDTKYLLDSNHTYLTSPQWIQYQLDNFSTVEEVLKNLSSLLPFGWEWHFFVADKYGNSASIEFIKGNLVIHRGKEMPVQCLTNSSYLQSIEYYNINKNQIIPERLSKHSDQDNSLERFAIAANKSTAFDTIKQDESIEYAFNVLSSIAGNEGYAKRSIIYDIKNQVVYFRTDLNIKVRKLFLNDLDFDTINQYLDLTEDCEGNIFKLLKESKLETDLDLHNRLENLLMTFFKPNDEFPNLDISVKTYLDEIKNYYINNELEE